MISGCDPILTELAEGTTNTYSIQLERIKYLNKLFYLSCEHFSVLQQNDLIVECSYLLIYKW